MVGAVCGQSVATCWWLAATSWTTQSRRGWCSCYICCLPSTSLVTLTSVWLLLLLQDDWVRHDDSQPSCLMYDSSRRRLVTAFHRPYVWQHKVRVVECVCTTQDDQMCNISAAAECGEHAGMDK
jgi:hypothetical protein